MCSGTGSRSVGLDTMPGTRSELVLTLSHQRSNCSSNHHVIQAELFPWVLVNLDQCSIGRWIRRRGSDLAGKRRTHIYYMPTPTARPFAQPYSLAVDASDHMRGRDRKARCDEESRSLRASISVETGRARLPHARRQGGGILEC